jgi:Mg2+/citrate symporter
MSEWLIMIIVGAVFIVLGILAVFWGIREEKRIFEALSKKPDLREFTQKHIETPQPGALKIGGWIALALGVLVAAAGIVLLVVG